MKPRMNQFATVLEYREVHDRAADIEELISLIRDLDPVDSAILLCQISADLRLTKRDREAVAKTQQEVSGGMLSDETIARLKDRFGQAHMSDRPMFHPTQLLNVLRLVADHSCGKRSPLTDESARYALGEACLMMSDLMMTERERKALISPNSESVTRALMVQMLGPIELLNPLPIEHVAYRSRIMFRELLQNETVLDRIRNYGGFDFGREFARSVGVPLPHWLLLLLAFYSYLFHYRGQDGSMHPEFLAIGRLQFGKDSTIPQRELDATLRILSTTLDELRQELRAARPVDWRFDSVPFRSKPFIELQPGKFFCCDLGLLVEKIHSGVFWAIHDALPAAERSRLSGAWGILFEEYVNSFLADRQFKDFSFWPTPEWKDGGEGLDGCFMKGPVFMPMEYKGGFLSREARYSGDVALFESDLERKIVKGCNQLARRIETLFHRRRESRNPLRNVPVDHVTRVVPLLVVQDHILNGPLVNWWLNKRFNTLLNRSLLRPEVKVDALNVVGIRELETMAESAENAGFDLFHGLQYKCYADPEMHANLHNFLLELPGYGEGKSSRIERLLDEQLKEAQEYLFEKL